MFVGFSFYGIFADVLSLALSIVKNASKNYKGLAGGSREFCFEKLSYCFLGTRYKQPYFTIFRNIIKIVDWIGFGIFFILAIATVKESWKAYLNSATSWAIERHPIQNQPTFYLSFGLSTATIHYFYCPLILGRDFNITFTANSKR